MEECRDLLFIDKLKWLCSTNDGSHLSNSREISRHFHDIHKISSIAIYFLLVSSFNCLIHSRLTYKHKRKNANLHVSRIHFLGEMNRMKQKSPSISSEENWERHEQHVPVSREKETRILNGWKIHPHTQSTSRSRISHLQNVWDPSKKANISERLSQRRHTISRYIWDDLEFRVFKKNFLGRKQLWLLLLWDFPISINILPPFLRVLRRRSDTTERDDVKWGNCHEHYTLARSLLHMAWEWKLKTQNSVGYKNIFSLQTISVSDISGLIHYSSGTKYTNTRKSTQTVKFDAIVNLGWISLPENWLVCLPCTNCESINNSENIFIFRSTTKTDGPLSIRKSLTSTLIVLECGNLWGKLELEKNQNFKFSTFPKCQIVEFSKFSHWIFYFHATPPSRFSLHGLLALSDERNRLELWRMWECFFVGGNSPHVCRRLERGASVLLLLWKMFEVDHNMRANTCLIFKSFSTILLDCEKARKRLQPLSYISSLCCLLFHVNIPRWCLTHSWHNVYKNLSSVFIFSRRFFAPSSSTSFFRPPEHKKLFSHCSWSKQRLI